MNQKLTTLRIREQVFDVYVDTEGRFLVTLDSHGVSAESLAELRKKLLAATKQKQQALNVQFEQIEDDGKTHPGTVTGVHTNGNLIVRWPGQKGIEQLSRYCYGDKMTRPLTTEERIAWVAICRETRELEKRKEKFLAECGIDLRKTVREEMEKLTGEQGGIEL